MENTFLFSKWIAVQFFLHFRSHLNCQCHFHGKSQKLTLFISLLIIYWWNNGPFVPSQKPNRIDNLNRLSFYEAWHLIMTSPGNQGWMQKEFRFRGLCAARRFKWFQFNPSYVVDVWKVQGSSGKLSQNPFFNLTGITSLFLFR